MFRRFDVSTYLAQDGPRLVSYRALQLNLTFNVNCVAPLDVRGKCTPGLLSFCRNSLLCLIGSVTYVVHDVHLLLKILNSLR